MKSIITNMVIGVVLLFLAVAIFLSTMPISFLLDKVQLPKNLEVSSVTGSVWSGQMQVVWRGSSPIQLPGLNERTELFWKWCPNLSLVRVCIDMDNPEIKSNAHVTYGLINRMVKVSDAVLNFNLKDYPFKYKQFPMSVSGVSKLNIHEVEFELGQLLSNKLAADGNIKSLTNNDIVMGDYKISAVLEDQRLAVNITGGTESFSVKGKVKLDLNQARPKYSYVADLSSQNDWLLEVLKIYAQNSAKGKVTFAGSGVM